MAETAIAPIAGPAAAPAPNTALAKRALGGGEPLADDAVGGRPAVDLPIPMIMRCPS